MNSISKKEFYESITHKDKDIIIEGWEKIFSQMNEDQYFIEDHGEFGTWVKSRFGIQQNIRECDSGDITQYVEHSFKCIQHKIDLWNEFLLKERPPLMREIRRQLFMIEKPFRSECLLEVLKKQSSHLSDEEVWDLVTDLWSEVEFNSNDRDIWLELFSLRESIDSLKQELPEEMTIYRGGHEEGFSWTLSREVGEWFSNRFDEDTPFLEKVIKKSDVLFYTNDRNEEEVVLIPGNVS